MRGSRFPLFHVMPAAAAVAVLSGLAAAQTVRLNAGPIQFDLIEIDDRFISEGVAVVDVNKDGFKDLFAGDYWYQAPNDSYFVAGVVTGGVKNGWIRREFKTPTSSSGSITPVNSQYSKCHGSFVGDFNNDGFPDVLVVPFHGEPPRWYANPNDPANTRWASTALGFNYGVEQSIWTEVKPGVKSLVAANLASGGSWAYWTPTPSGPWTETKISGNNAPKATIYGHGLGVADIDGDGKPDLIHQLGWYRQTETGLWTYNPSQFFASPSESNEPSHILVYDFDKDGRPDILSAASHNPGVWWWRNLGNGQWQQNTITNPGQSQGVRTSHAMVLADLDLDGHPDIISGKRFYAHNTGNDGNPVPLWWLKYTPPAAPGGDPVFAFHFIRATEAGVGTQFEVTDINGDGYPDIAVSNKKGTKIYLQVSRGPIGIAPSRALRAERGNGILFLRSNGIYLEDPLTQRVMRNLNGRRVVMPSGNGPLRLPER